MTNNGDNKPKKNDFKVSKAERFGKSQLAVQKDIS